jgi:hypothetical protein
MPVLAPAPPGARIPVGAGGRAGGFAGGRGFSLRMSWTVALVFMASSS